MFALIRHERFAQEIRRSRFLAQAAPIDGEADARRLLADWSDGQATHNCWAWRVGPVYRFSDDGEPGGTAGKPILQAIDGQDLDRTLVVVTRWFGGVLLGTGGLIRAYGGTAAACLRAAGKTPLVVGVRATIDCPFADLALVQARLGAWSDVRVDEQRFTDRGAILIVSIPLAGAGAISAALREMTSGRVDVSLDAQTAG